MILGAHQPDFFPYPGFWHKMIHSDIFDLAIYDKFVKSRYMQRVTIGEPQHWFGLPIQMAEDRICNIRIAGIPDKLTSVVVWEKLYNTYHNAPYFKEYENEIFNLINRKAHKGKLLWKFNFDAILLIKNILEIDTPISISRPLNNKGTDGIIELCKIYNANTYLSGIGGKEYQDETLFPKHGIELLYVNYCNPCEQSILHLLFNFDISVVKEMIQ